MNTDKWASLGRCRRSAMITPKKVRPSILRHVPVISKYSLNSKGEIFPITKKKLDKQIWWVRKVNILPDDIIRYISLLCLLSNERKWKKNHKRLSRQSFNKVSIVENSKFLHTDEKIDDGNETWYFAPGSDMSRIETPFDVDLDIDIDWLNDENDILHIAPGSEDMDQYKYSMHMPRFWMKSICHKYIKKWIDSPVGMSGRGFGIQIIGVDQEEISGFLFGIIFKRRLWISNEEGEEVSTNDFIVCPKCRCYYCDIIRSVASHY